MPFEFSLLQCKQQKQVRTQNSRLHIGLTLTTLCSRSPHTKQILFGPNCISNTNYTKLCIWNTKYKILFVSN